MESIGQILKAARERRNMTIADVVAATKMTGFFAQAIEADNFGALVAPVYARGFIRLYAECVGLDPLPLLKQFESSGRAPQEFVPPNPQRPAPVKTGDGHTGRAKTQPAQADRRTEAVSPAPLRAAKRAPAIRRSLAWLAELRAERLFALTRKIGGRIRWPHFELPAGLSGRLSMPALAWRRITIVAFAFLLIVAASLAWQWSRREPSLAADACRWLAEPPAPYLSIEARTAPSMQTPNIQRPTPGSAGALRPGESNVE